MITGRYNMGTYMIDKVAGDAKAIVRIGRRKVYLVGKLDDYINKLAE